MGRIADRFAAMAARARARNEARARGEDPGPDPDKFGSDVMVFHPGKHPEGQPFRAPLSTLLAVADASTLFVYEDGSILTLMGEASNVSEDGQLVIYHWVNPRTRRRDGFQLPDGEVAVNGQGVTEKLEVEDEAGKVVHFQWALVVMETVDGKEVPRPIRWDDCFRFDEENPT